MSRENVDAVLRFLGRTNIPTVDITGGAPELHPGFRLSRRVGGWLGRHVMDRCNLTVIFEPGKDYLPEFFKRHRSRAGLFFAMLLRGERRSSNAAKGRLNVSIRALQIFNELGYGQSESGLVLNLVYNPVGPHLPPPQEKLEQDYKRILNEKFGIVFNQLYCLSNMPITRYATHLKLRGEYEQIHGTCWKAVSTRDTRSGDVPQSDKRRLGRDDL